MRRLIGRASGRADPFGLLVLVVFIALAATLAVQVQADSQQNESVAERVSLAQ